MVCRRSMECSSICGEPASARVNKSRYWPGKTVELAVLVGSAELSELVELVELAGFGELLKLDAGRGACPGAFGGPDTSSPARSRIIPDWTMESGFDLRRAAR